MKKYLFLLVVSFAIVSCNSNKNNNKSDVFTVPSLLEKAEGLVDKEVKITGLVDHVCSHSGRRCFLVDSVADKSIKIEAAGDIESFDKALIGSNLVVTGILKEEQLKATEIDEWETNLVEEYGDIENGGEKCSTEMANITSMREWMKEHNKDYYAIYYIDGLSYEVVE
jgi:cytochrome c-type biogenesis protein CcmE